MIDNFDDARETLRQLKGLRCHYLSAIENHEQNVEEAAQKIANAKNSLIKILDDKEQAPKKIKDIERRIIIMEATSKTKLMIVPVSSNLQKLVLLRKRLANLEAEIQKEDQK